MRPIRPDAPCGRGADFFETSALNWCPHVESNHDLSLRRAAFYPFNYGDNVLEVGIEPTRPYGHIILSDARLPITPLEQLFYFFHDGLIVNYGNLDTRFSDFLTDCHGDFRLCGQALMEGDHQRKVVPIRISRIATFSIPLKIIVFSI